MVQRKLRDRLSFEVNNYFFICNSCEESIFKFNFDEAFELNFRCPGCGSPLEAQDNKKIIEFLKKRIAQNQKIKLSSKPEN